MANNTTLARLFFASRAQVDSNGNVGPQAGSSITHRETGGVFTANGATPVTVTEPLITANSAIVFTLKTAAGTVGATPGVKTITPGTGFTVAATASDTSVYNYLVIG